jgi:hypothetical protein
MVLLSVKSALEMFAELVLIDSTQNSFDKTLSFASFTLKNNLTSHHQIKMVFGDRHRQLVIFVTESKH